jgi:hypothetical protein
MRKITWSGEWVIQDDVMLALARRGYSVACFDGVYHLTSWAEEKSTMTFNSKEELNGIVSLLISDTDVEEAKEFKKPTY